MVSATGTGPRSRPRAITMMRSATIPNFGEISGEKQNRDTSGALRDQPVADRDHGADVEAAGRVSGENDGNVVAELAGNDELLLIAAGEIGHARPRS